MGLSKSKYTRGVQCPKICWCEIHVPEEYDDSVLNMNVLKTGNEVGDLAMGYFGDFVEVPFSRDFHGMARTTRELMEAGERVICEATFEYEGNLCMVDILLVEEDGVRLYEVKSSTSVSEIYYHDVAYQCWLLRKCGLTVKSASLMHLNNEYVRHGDLNLQELFVAEDLTEDALARFEEVEARVALLDACIAQDEEPCSKPGVHCFDPYECGYRAWCWRNEPSPNVFDISGLSAKRAEKLYDEGVMGFDQVKEANVKLRPRQQLQVDAALGLFRERFDAEAASAFLDTLSFPLYFLDFETFQAAVPLYEGTKVYQQIPFQYSLHYLEAPDAELQHVEFLAQEGADPRRALAEQLVRDIPEGACVIAYNMSFEKGVIKALADMFPDLADLLLAIRESMKDLMVLFRAGDYYRPAMEGSYSIKYVLPALFPDDAEMNYAQLEGVHNGTEAMTAFKDLVDLPAEERAATRAQLLAYCRLDTLAMVRIWEHLRRRVS